MLWYKLHGVVQYKQLQKLCYHLKLQCDERYKNNPTSWVSVLDDMPLFLCLGGSISYCIGVLGDGICYVIAVLDISIILHIINGYCCE